MTAEGMRAKKMKHTFSCKEEIEIEQQTADHAILLLHVDGAEDEHIDHHAPLQQGLQRPLVGIIMIRVPRPGGRDLMEERLEGGAKRRLAIRAGRRDPEALRLLCDGEGAELGDEPDEHGGEGGGQEEAGDAAEGGLCDAAEGALDVAHLGLADGLQGAHVARDEGEDGDADAAVQEDADDGPLQDARGVLGRGAVAGVEEGGIESAGEMGNDDGDGCQSSQALGWRLVVLDVTGTRLTESWTEGRDLRRPISRSRASRPWCS